MWATRNWKISGQETGSMSLGTLLLMPSTPQQDLHTLLKLESL